ncbi:MAG: hypothetical protein ACJAWF_003463, partial [Candidatus Azotimanducaceae bacterium]
QPLRVYEGAFEVFVEDPDGPLQVSFQACDNTVCLRPETLTFKLNL